MISVKSQLKHVIKSAIDEGCKYIAVVILHTEYDSPELIINHKIAFKSKLEYYDNAYNDNLELKTCSKIHIVDAFSAYSMEELLHKCNLYDIGMNIDIYSKYLAKFRAKEEDSDKK